MWECTWCSFNNKSADVRCEMCRRSMRSQPGGGDVDDVVKQQSVDPDADTDVGDGANGDDVDPAAETDVGTSSSGSSSNSDYSEAPRVKRRIVRTRLVASSSSSSGEEGEEEVLFETDELVDVVVKKGRKRSSAGSTHSKPPSRQYGLQLQKVGVAPAGKRRASVARRPPPCPPKPRAFAVAAGSSATNNSGRHAGSSATHPVVLTDSDDDAFASPPPKVPPRASKPKAKPKAKAKAKAKQPAVRIADFLSRQDVETVVNEAPSPPVAAKLPPAPSADWLERSEPSTSAALAVHPRKVADVRRMIKYAVTGVWEPPAVKGKAAAPPMAAPRQPSLLVLFGPPGIGKSVTVKVLAKELGYAVRSWVDTGSRGGAHGVWRPDREAHTDLTSPFDVPYVSALQDFETFMMQCALYPTLALHTTEGGAAAGTQATAAPQGPQVGILEEVPRPRDRDGLRRVRSAFKAYLNRARFPVVLVVSDTDESGDAANTASLTRWLSAEVVGHPRTHCIKMNPVAPTLMKKALLRILKQQSATAPTSVIDDVVSTSGGDLRHAVLSLQLYSALPAGERAKAATASKNAAAGGAGGKQTSIGACGRDDFIGALHSLGRLLHAKRNPDGSLEFMPETVIGGAPYTPETSAAFLQENCPPFFSDIDELASAFDLFSTADVWHGVGWSRGGMPAAAFPAPYVASLASRAVAGTNTKPASSTFRPLHKPAMFAVSRTQAANASTLTQLALGAGRDVVDVSHSGGTVWLDPAGAVPGSVLTTPSVAHAVYRVPYMAQLSRSPRFPQPWSPLSAQLACAGSQYRLTAPSDLADLEWQTAGGASSARRRATQAPAQTATTLPEDPIED